MGEKKIANGANRITDEAFLQAFGERIRAERARRGMSRKLLAEHAGMSERYISQIESGRGNISLVLLRHIATALGLPLAQLVDDESPTAAMRLAQQFLSRLSPPQLEEAHQLLGSRFATAGTEARSNRIALVGLRGAGKSTLGRALARARNLPFFELDREIERLSATSLGVIIELYGQQAYRRYEAQALNELIETQPRFVVATGGSIVSEAATWESLLRHCFTVWIRASPEEHMSRVIAQGDRRPMAGSERAMDDLRRILDERSPLYARADLEIDTSRKTEKATLKELIRGLPAK